MLLRHYVHVIGKSILNLKSLIVEWLEQASQWHEMYCHDLEVMSWNRSRVELGVHSASVLSRTWTNNIKGNSTMSWSISLCSWFVVNTSLHITWWVYVILISWAHCMIASCTAYNQLSDDSPRNCAGVFFACNNELSVWDQWITVSNTTVIE